MTLLTLGSAAHEARADDPPNILLIMLDDVGAESFESYFGNPTNTADGQRIDTPNITALADTGMRFTNAYATPLCTTSRVQVMTGRYNYTNYRAFNYLDHTETTFAEVLRDGGYTTAVAGKWQLSDTSDRSARHDSGYGPDAAPAPTGVTAEAGTVTPTVLRESYGFDTYLVHNLNNTFSNSGSRYWNPNIETPSADGTQSVFLPTTDADYGPNLFAEHTKQFITDAAANSTPFFAYMPMALPHDPWVPTPDQSPNNSQKDDSDTANFDDNVEYADKLIGQVIAHLDDPDGDPLTNDSVRQNTVIIFTTDNGASSSITVQHDGGTVIGDKINPTHAGTHAPFIINWQGTVAAGTSDRMVDLTDVFPTLMEVAGVQTPNDLTIDGHAIIDADGNVQDNRDVAYGYYKPLWGSAIPDGFTAEYAIEQRYKLYDDGSMFDILSDPNETTDLALGTLDTTQQAARDKLQAELDKQTAQRLIAPKFLNGYTRQASDTDLDGDGDTRANTVLIVGDNNSDDQHYRTVAEFRLTDPNVSDLVNNFGSATLVTQVTLTKGSVPDIRLVAMTADENGDVETGNTANAADDYQAAGVEIAVFTGLSEGDTLSIDVTDAVLADLGQAFTAFRFEAVNTDLDLIPGAQQVRLGGVLGEGVGTETATRLILGALGDIDADGRIDGDDIDLIETAIANNMTSARYDLDRDDAALTTLDKDYLIRSILGTEYADLDLDGDVDAQDLATLVSHWKTSTNRYAEGDLNNDGIIDNLDLALMAYHWGFGTQGNTPTFTEAFGAVQTPEPGSAATLSTLGILLLLRRTK